MSQQILPAFPEAVLEPHPSRVAPDGCISIVGMAAAGKSALGRELARIFSWAHVDSDNVIEAIYGARLQKLADSLSKEEFLDMEGQVIQSLRLSRCVVSTGGSVVYREEAVRRLKKMGPVLYIDVPLPIILERIARKPDRGLAIAPGQTIEDLFEERRLLYEKAADYTIKGGEEAVSVYAMRAAELLASPA